MVIAETSGGGARWRRARRRGLDAAARRDGQHRRRRCRARRSSTRRPPRTCAWTCEVGDAAAVDAAFSRAAHVVRLDTWVQRVTGVTDGAARRGRRLGPRQWPLHRPCGRGGPGTDADRRGRRPRRAGERGARDGARGGRELRDPQQLLSGVRAGRLGGAAARPSREVDGRAARGVPRRLPGPRPRGPRRAGSRRRRAPSSRFAAPTPATSAPTPSRSTRSTRAWRSRARSTACPPWRCAGAPSSPTRRRPRRTAARAAPRSCSSWSG